MIVWSVVNIEEWEITRPMARQSLDEKRDLIRWTNQPFSYDPMTVADGRGVPLHPGAIDYYRTRGYPLHGAEASK